MAESSSSADEAQPQLVGDTVSSFCSTGPRPLLMTGYFVSLLRGFFSDARNREEPRLRRALWTRDPANAQIYIESATAWDPAYVEKQPAIIVRRNDWTPLQLGINDELQGTWPLEAQAQYSVAIRGSHTLFCIAKEGGVCELLATEVYRFLLGCSAVIRTDLDLLKFRLAGVGTTGKLARAKAVAYTTPVTVSYAMQDTWTLHLHAPLVRAITLSVLQ